MNDTYTAESEKVGLNSTFDLPDTEGKLENQTQETVDGNQDENHIPIVTVVIEDKEKGEEKEKDEDESKESKDENEKNNEKTGKAKTPKKKKFNVVKDFKKPNTTNVVSKLSEYLKAPLPVKPPKEDKNNTEAAKNKRNSLKGKIDLKGSKLETKVNEEKKPEEKKEKEIIEKEPVKKVKRTPPKSKWDSIMSQIDNKKGEEKNKPKAEVKSKLAELLKAPPPPPPKKDVEPKPKRKLTNAIPDYSKVQSKLKYTAPPPKPKVDESPNRSKTESPSRARKDSTSARKTDSPSRKTDSPSRKTDSPTRSNAESPAGLKEKSPSHEQLDLDEKQSKEIEPEVEKSCNASGDSVKRPEIKDGALHIDLAEALERRSSAVGTGSGVSSVQSSRTDLSTTGADDEESAKFKVPSKSKTDFYLWTVLCFHLYYFAESLFIIGKV